MINFDSADLTLIFPELTLTVTFIAALILDLALQRRGKYWVTAISVIGLLAAIQAQAFLFGYPQSAAFDGMIVRDAFGTFFQFILGFGALAIILISAWTREINDQPTAGTGEYYVLVISATIGMYFLVEATNLLMIYLSIELMSLSGYLLTGWLTKSRRSTEAGLKYIIYGATASCSMIYGISLLYGLTGSLGIVGVRTWMTSGPGISFPFIVALLLVLAGFLFKVAAFPLFQWAPDVYQGAPTPIAAFLAVGSKTAGMGALVRFLLLGFAGFEESGYTALAHLNWPLLIAVISAATMTVGNFMALGQNNIKRLLAYSSIAHAGYILMGIPVMSVAGIKAIIFYLAVYLFMNLGAFLVVIVLENKGVAGEIPLYRGMGSRAPAIAVAMSIFLFSLTGLPPLAGFIGKLYLFAGLISSKIYWLAIVGVLNSVVSLFYYARIVKVMFLEKGGEDATAIKADLPLHIIVWLLVAPILALGVYWEPLMNLAQKAAAAIGI